jgi:hypothetical protein
MHIHIVKAIDRDLSLEMRYLIQLRFLIPPFEAGLPVTCQSLDIWTESRVSYLLKKRVMIGVTMLLHIPSPLLQARQRGW